MRAYVRAYTLAQKRTPIATSRNGTLFETIVSETSRRLRDDWRESCKSARAREVMLEERWGEKFRLNHYVLMRLISEF